MGSADSTRGKKGGKKRVHGKVIIEDLEAHVPAIESEADRLALGMPEISYSGLVNVDPTTTPKTKKIRRGKRGGKSSSHENTAVDILPPSVEFEEKEDQARQSFSHQENNQYAPISQQELDIETRNYFESIEKILDEESYDDISVFLTSVYKEVDGKEIEIIKDYNASRIFEKILRISTDFQIRLCMNRLLGHFMDLCQHQFGSYVCQTLLNLGADITNREQSGKSIVELHRENAGQLPSMESLIVAMCQELDGSWINLMKHRYGCHILRTILLILSEESIQARNLKSKRSQKFSDNQQMDVNEARSVPPSFKERFGAISSSIMNCLTPSDFKVWSIDPVVNPVLQLLISFPNFSSFVIDLLLRDDNCQFLNILIHDPVGSHLMEKILCNISQEKFKNIYLTIFRDHLAEYSEHHVANFVVQHLIMNCKDSSVLLQIESELSPAFEHLYFRNRPGVIAKLFEAAVEQKLLQSPLTKSLVSIFNSNTRNDMLQIVVFMRSIQELKASKFQTRPHVQGALILQHFLSFDEPHNRVVIEGLFSFSPDEYLHWACDPICSRILEKFFVSCTVTIQCKLKLLRRLTGHFVDLAKDKYASHILDKIWRLASLDSKELIAGELAAHDFSLADSTYGRFALRNYKIDLFKRRKNEWMELEKRIQKKKDFFKDLF